MKRWRPGRRLEGQRAARARKPAPHCAAHLARVRKVWRTYATDIDRQTVLVYFGGAGARNYNIQSAADHAHTVTFTAAQLAQLKPGMTIAVQSSLDAGHQHDIGESCV